MPLFIISFLLHLAALFFTVTATDETNTVKGVPYLVIEPITSREYGLYVIKRVQDTLNLTCTLYDNSTDVESKYNITWTIPSSSTNSKNRVVIQSSANSVNLVVPHLEARDEGEYACSAQPMDKDFRYLHESVNVNIKNRKKVCGETMFACSLSKLQNCIPRRFKCDGHLDCQMGEDEDQQVCGESPCLNKLQCEDPRSTVVRCIPKSWCCNIRADANCTIREPLSCCPLSLHKAYLDERNYYATHQPHYTDMTFLQTTIYTVIGCAMVFMIVMTVLVVAICRVHMKRTHCPSSVPQPPQNVPLCDLDVYLNRGCMVDSVPGPGFLVTYNINNGVQIVGHVVDPPPYCEVISVPPREGPPPPYTSHETLAQPEMEALLTQSTVALGPRTEDQPLRRAVAEQDSLPSHSQPTS